MIKLIIFYIFIILILYFYPQNMMVDENILKLELRRLRETLNSRSDSVLSLEKRRLQLETAMKERQQEINIHMEMLQSQVRAADTERSQISTELHERISKIDKLRKRYGFMQCSVNLNIRKT